MHAVNAADVAEMAKHSGFTREFIQDRNHLNVWFAANGSSSQVTYSGTAEFI